MKCPICGREMKQGFLRSARPIYFTAEEYGDCFIPHTAEGKDIKLTSHNWTRPTCEALYCPDCQKILVDCRKK